LPTEPDKPIPEEVLKLRQEAEALRREAKLRGPSKSLMVRARDLRKRIKAKGAVIEHWLAHDSAVQVAIFERTGREAQDGDTILPEDDKRALEIVEALQSRSGSC
jgi:hypothetical protein